MPMRITGITSRVLAYDLTEFYGDTPIPSGVGGATCHTTLVTFHTDVGLDGHTMQFGGLGEGRAIAHALHQGYGEDLLGRNLREHERIWQDLRRKNRHMYNVSDAIVGAIDVALWDLRGKEAGQPIAVLLGLARESIPAYATARAIDPTPEDVFDEAKAMQAAGFLGYKVQFWDGPARDIPRLRAAREAVGPNYPLMEDAAGGYTYLQALEVGRVLEELDYHWFEEPLPDRQLGQLRRLTDELRIPVLAMETLSLHELPEHIRAGAADIARGDVLIKSGITGLRKALATCELFGMNLEIHGLGAVLLDIANLHVALSVENCAWVESHHPVYEQGILGAPLGIDEHGCRVLPPGSGLGVELDWDWIDDNTVEVLTTGGTSPGG